MSYQITRRRFTAGLGGALLAGAWARPGFAEGKEITVLNWKGYGTDESFTLKAFADLTGITIKHDYFNSEPEMLTKLRTNPGAYDVVLINSARTQQAQAEGLIDPIDFATIPNSQSLAPALKEHANLKADGKIYGLAWVWGMNSLAVRKGIAGDSWTILSDPKYAGKLALFDDAVTAVGIGALLTGQDANDPKDLKAVTEALKAMKSNVKLMWSSEDEWNKAFAANAFDISVYWSGACVRSIRKLNLPVEFVVPKEGAIGWLDSLAIPATSTKKEDGLKFLNYMIDPGFYQTWTAEAGAPASANTAAMEKLPADDLNRVIHKPEYLTKLTFMAALPDDRRQSFSDLWEEVKAFYAK
jgi:spermidine/putrescine transport system substrate-binding protein